jgi:formylaminopyrimidine deformylase / aminopyrimidine aminohydrolase
MSKKVAEHVLSYSIPSYSSATQHPFLVAAGDGHLSPELLSLWLSQDRIYAAHAYPRFIGRLIAAIPFGIQSTDGSAAALNDRILKILVSALNNIVREVGFFDTIAGEQGWNLDRWKERKGTRDYTAEMSRVSSGGGEASLVEGLVFLWAMERVRKD